MSRIKLEKMILIGLLLLVVASFSAGPQEDSQVFTVCPEGPPACQFSRIQDAINASPDGATIQVRSGIYRENLFITHSLKLMGSGADKTVLESLSTLKWQDVILALGEIHGVQEVAIEGLTITDIPDGGHAVKASKVASVSVRASNIIYSPSEYWYLGVRGGISLDNVINVRIEENTIQGGGVIIVRAREVVVQDNTLNAGAAIDVWESMRATIMGNTIEDAWLGSIGAEASMLYIANNTIRRSGGVGIAANGNNVLIQGNTILNGSGTGVGIGGKAELKDNIIARNRVGVSVSGNGNIIEGNTIQDNHWYGIWVTSLESVEACRSNIVQGNAQGNYVIGPAPGFVKPSEELRRLCEESE